jgi:hypothetical protein
LFLPSNFHGSSSSEFENDVAGDFEDRPLLVTVVRSLEEIDDRLKASSQIWPNSFDTCLASSFQWWLTTRGFLTSISLPDLEGLRTRTVGGGVGSAGLLYRSGDNIALVPSRELARFRLS